MNVVVKFYFICYKFWINYLVLFLDIYFYIFEVYFCGSIFLVLIKENVSIMKLMVVICRVVFYIVFIY